MKFLVFALSFVWASACFGHDGAHTVRVIADVVRAEKIADGVAIELSVVNLGEGLVLVGARAGETEVAISGGTRAIGPDETVLVDLHVPFKGAVPRLFTLLLDFGESGVAATLIIPKKAR